METRTRNRLLIGGGIILAVFLLCLIFIALTFLTLSEITLRSDVDNLATHVASQAQNAGRSGDQTISGTTTSDFRSTAEARRRTATPSSSG